MNNALSRIAFSATLLVGATAFAQAPALIPLQGFVTDDQGEPLDGELVLDVRLLTSSVDGDELHVESQIVDADMGYFATDLGLGDELDLTIFRDNAEVWVEIAIEEEVLEPRIQFGTVPYAAWADSAGDAQTIGGVTLEELQAAVDWADLTGVPEDLLDGDDDTFDWADLTGIPEDLLDGDDVGEDVDLSGYQLALTGECPEGSSLRAINRDGTFFCEEDTDTDTDTTYDAGAGLALTGTTFSVDTDAIQTRVTGTCAAGFSISAIAADGTVSCQEDTDTDTDTTYSAGSGITLADTTFSVDTAVVQARVSGTCAAGSSIRTIAADGTVTCEADTDTDTTYSAGTGLSLLETVFSIASDGVGSAQLADNAVGNEHMQNDAIGSNEVTNNSLTASDLAENSVGSSELANNAVDRGAMQNDSVGSPEIVNGSITSEDLGANSVALSEMADDAVGNAEMRDNAIGNAEMQNDAIGSAEVIDASITNVDLAYGSVMTLPMFPNAETSICTGSALGGAMFGSTTSTTSVYVGNIYYDESDNDTGLRHNFTRARLQVTCRGSGVMELIRSCSDSAPIATVDCAGGFRPWTATSDEFNPGSTANWNFRVRSDSSSSTFEWANPQVILY